MKQKRKEWLTLAVPFFPESSEAISALLFRLGALGCEEREGVFVAYFEDQDEAAILNSVNSGLRRITENGLKTPSAVPSVGRIPEENWHEGWKKYFKPIFVDDALVIRPPWEKLELAPDAKEIILEPKQAFGTGNHATTWLMLKAIADRRETLPTTALDVGTGSGVLALAHALFQPQAVVTAFDNDPIAIENAVEYAADHGLLDRIHFFVGNVASLRRTKTFPMIYANLQSFIIAPILPDLFKLLSDDGDLFLSGILETEEAEMRRAASEHGFTTEHVEHSGEWIRMDLKH